MENSSIKDWGITILRVVVGIVYLVHGSQKLFIYGFNGVEGAFTHMGIPMPALTAPLVLLLEFLGGIGLIAGLLTRWLAILFAIEMAVAVIKVHFAGGFFLPQGYEYALTLAGANVALAMAGPGAGALDHGLGKLRPRAGTMVDPV